MVRIQVRAEDRSSSITFTISYLEHYVRFNVDKQIILEDCSNCLYDVESSSNEFTLGLNKEIITSNDQDQFIDEIYVEIDDCKGEGLVLNFLAREEDDDGDDDIGWSDDRNVSIYYPDFIPLGGELFSPEKFYLDYSDVDHTLVKMSKIKSARK